MKLAHGYRVDVLCFATGGYIEYLGRKNPLTREMADALGRGLKRQNAAGRIVEQPSGEVVEVWGKTPTGETHHGDR